MKRKLSKAGRQKIVEASKRRWAKFYAERTASKNRTISATIGGTGLRPHFTRAKRRKRRRTNNHKLTGKQVMAQATRIIADLVRNLPDEELVKLIRKY